MASIGTYEDRSDAELLKAALARDEDAFLLLYAKLKGGVFRYAFYMTSSSSAAEEVTQEVFMTLLKEGTSYREARGDVGAYVFGIARNFIRRLKRRERRYEALPDDDAVLRLAGSLVTEPEALQRKMMRDESLEQLQAAVASLPEHYAQTVILCDLCELSYAQAASRLGCAVGTVRSRLNRAHSQLARKLKPMRSAEIGIRDTGTEGCVI
jgi:RNA polymerase sigma-70 factor (ECF subfamily)